MKRERVRRTLWWLGALALAGGCYARKTPEMASPGDAAQSARLDVTTAPAPPSEEPVMCAETQGQEPCLDAPGQARVVVPPPPEGVLDAVRRRFDRLEACLPAAVVGPEGLALDISARVSSDGSVGDAQVHDASGRLDLVAQACVTDAVRSVFVDSPNDGGLVHFRLNVAPADR